MLLLFIVVCFAVAESSLSMNLVREGIDRGEVDGWMICFAISEKSWVEREYGGREVLRVPCLLFEGFGWAGDLGAELRRREVNTRRLAAEEAGVVIYISLHFKKYSVIHPG